MGKNAKSSPKLFYFYAPKDLPEDKSSFSHYGGEADVELAWDTMILGYKNALDALFEKYKNSVYYSIVDSMAYPICFISRQIVELVIKYLYLKYSYMDDKHEILECNHNLLDAWDKLKPVLKARKKESPSKVSLGEFEKYIMEMNNFDRTSMKMRYPVDKQLNASNPVGAWLDIPFLYYGMVKFYELYTTLDYDLERRVKIIEDGEAIRTFVKAYNEKKRSINDLFIIPLGNCDDDSEKEIGIVGAPNEYNLVFSHYNYFDDDTKIIIECLYYVGQSIDRGKVNLPLENRPKILAVITLCLNRMELDHLEFGTPLEEGQTNIYGKKSSLIVRFCEATMKYLDEYYCDNLA